MKENSKIIGDVQLTQQEYRVAKLASDGYALPHIQTLLESEGVYYSTTAIRKTLERVYKKLGMIDPKYKGIYNHQVRLALLFHKLTESMPRYITRESIHRYEYQPDRSIKVIGSRRIEINTVLDAMIFNWRKFPGRNPWLEAFPLKAPKRFHENLPEGCAVKVEIDLFEPYFIKWKLRFVPPIREKGRVIGITSEYLVPDSWSRTTAEQDHYWSERTRQNAITSYAHNFQGYGYSLLDVYSTDRMELELIFPKDYSVKHPELVILTPARERNQDYEARLIASDAVLANGISLRNLEPGMEVRSLKVVTNSPEKGAYCFKWLPSIDYKL